MAVLIIQGSVQVHISKQANLPSLLSKADTLHSVYQFENWERQLTLKVLVATIDAQWEAIQWGLEARQPIRSLYF